MGNYSLKNVTLGIGIGLVISSMINISMGSRELTVEEIKREAVKHNLIVLTTEDILSTQAPIDTPDITQSTADSPTAPADEGKITVDVESGMSSESIAELLKEKGVIKDAEDFLKRLGKLGKDDKLRLGSYEIPKNSSYDDIIKILTR